MNGRSNLFYFSIFILVFLSGLLFGLNWEHINVSFKWNPEIKLSDFSSLIVGVITFIFAYKSLNDSRLQFRIDKQPLLKAGVQFKPSTQEFYVSVKNVGLGTALNCRYQIIENNKNIPFTQLRDNLRELSSKTGNRSYSNPGTLLHAEERQIASIAGVNTSLLVEYRDYFEKHIEIKIEYEDMFSEKYQTYVFYEVDSYDNYKIRNLHDTLPRKHF